MDAPPLYRRKRRVTCARLVIAVVLAGLFSFAYYHGSHAQELALQDPRPHPFGASFVLVALPPLVWLIPFGTLVDHALATMHPALSFLAHGFGLAVAYALTVPLMMGLYMFNGPPTPEPFVTLGLATPLVGVAVAFLTAWLVPGSFATRAQRRFFDAQGMDSLTTP